MFKRKTSTYKVEVRTVTPIITLEDMIARVPTGVEVNASGRTLGAASVRFRVPSDDHHALNVAREIAGPRQFVLTTGYGVNQREIAQ